MIQNPQTAFWNTLRSLSGLRRAGAAPGLTGKLSGQSFRRGADGLGFGCEQRRRGGGAEIGIPPSQRCERAPCATGQLGRGNCFHLPVRRLAEEVGSQPAVTTTPYSQERPTARQS